MLKYRENEGRNWLDNLKLGYGGTKTEMERLLADAEKITGIHYDISNLNDIFQAIHVIQGELGITGTTAKEAKQTISGSIKAVQSAFQNFLSGAGGIEEVIDTLLTAGTNIGNAIIKMAPQIIDGIVKLIEAIIPMIPTVIKELLPGLLKGVVELVSALIKALPDIVIAIADMLPTLIPMIVDAILEIIPALIENLPLFIEAGIRLLGGIIIGLVGAIPILLARIGEIVVKLIDAFKNVNLEQIGKNILKGLWNGILSMKDWVVNKVKEIGKSILKGLKSILGIKSPSKEFAIIGRYSVLGYTEALDSMKQDVEQTVASTFGLSPQLTGSTALNYSPNVIVNNNVNMTTDPLGQVVGNIKTFSGGAKNDYNYGMGV